MCTLCSSLCVYVQCHSAISHPKCATFFSNWPFFVSMVPVTVISRCKDKEQWNLRKEKNCFLNSSYKVERIMRVFEWIVTWPPPSQQHQFCSLCRAAYWCQSEESAVVNQSDKVHSEERFAFRWNENQINQPVSLSLFLPPFLPPPPPLSQLSPLLSPHQWRPPLHDASLLRGFLCSLVSQVNTCMGQRREGGREGFLLKTTSPFSVFYNCHLQSPDPASRGPNRV